jgi:hypothetical protein
MQPNAMSIDIESSTSPETATDGEMLSGASLFCLHKLLRLNLSPQSGGRVHSGENGGNPWKLRRQSLRHSMFSGDTLPRTQFPVRTK